MILESAQAAAPAIEAGRSGIAVFLDAGVIGLILTNSGLLIKALIDRRAIKKAKESEGPGPGESLICRLRGEAIAALVESKKNTDITLVRLEGKVDQLLIRK
jgi:hypothetical protein